MSALSDNKTKAPLSFTRNGCQVDRLRRWCGWAFLLSLWACTLEAALSPRGPAGLVLEAPIEERTLYITEVERLFQAHEAQVGRPLFRGERGKVGLKLNTRGQAGLSTPVQLIRAVIVALEARGYAREEILLIDYSAHNMRQAGVMPPLSQGGGVFEGCPVIALDTGDFYDPEWFYDSPLPPALQQEPQLMSEARRGGTALEEGMSGRKSFLARPLIFDVDFWINMAVGADDPALGVDGVLANATLWNVSNSRRFMVNEATASAAVAEIAAIPELEERMVFSLVSMDRYQFIGGPSFKSIYTRSEPRLWLSSDPVALDRLLYDRMNQIRVLEGFPEILPVPRQLPFAASLGLGVSDPDLIRIRKVELPEGGAQVRPPPPPKPVAAPEASSDSKGWIQRVTPW